MKSNKAELVVLKRDKEKALNKGDFKLAGEICNRIGILYSEQENYEDAISEHKDELQFAKIIGDDCGAAIAHRLIGESLCEIGKFREALEHHNKYLEISQNNDNAVETQRAWATLGRTYYKIHCSDFHGDTEGLRSTALSEAQKAYVKALQMAESLKTELPPKEYAEMKARLLLNLGLAYDQKGQVSECADSIRPAFYLCKKFDLKEDLHRCQFCLATVYQNHGQITSALRIIDEAIVSAKQLKSKKCLGDCLYAKALMLLSMGDFSGAKLYARKAHRKCGPGSEDEIGTLLRTTVGLCRAEEEMESCDREHRYVLLEQMGDALASVGSNGQAIVQYQKMLECAENLQKSAKELAPIYSSLAQTYDDLKEYGKAIEYYNRELECREDNVEEQCKTLILIADVQEKQNCGEDVIRETYRRALSLAEKEDSVGLQVRCLEEMKGFQELHGLSVEQRVTEAKLDKLNKKLPKKRGVDDESCAHPYNLISLSDLSEYSDSDEEEAGRRPRKKRAATVKKNEKGETPLHRACMKGDLKSVKRYIEKGHPINPRDNCGWLPIHEAANYGYVEIVKFLLDNGALKNDSGGELCSGITPMHDAAVGGHFEVVEALLAKGASVTVTNSSGQTPLDCLIEWRKQNEFEIEKEEIEKCSRLEKQLKQMMKTRGVEYDWRTNEKFHSEGGWVDEDEEPEYRSVPALQNLQNLFNVDDEDDLDDCYDVPYLDDDVFDDWDDPDVACKGYQEAMEGIKKKISTLKEDVVKPGNIPALITSEDNIVDDWLIDDVMPSKRFKRDEEFFSRKTVKKKMRQTKLKRLPLEAEVSNKMTGISTKKNEVEFIENSILPLPSETLISEPPRVSQLFSVKVRIKDKDLLVPINDTSLTFGWLAEEAAQRYFTLAGMKPVLTLSRKDGAVLTSSDAIGSLIENSAEILGIVVRWEFRPLTERYESACMGLKTLRIAELHDSLSAVEESGILSVSDIGTRQNLLKPLFQALKFHPTLRCISLKGVQLSIDTMEYVATSVSTQPSLTRLCLQCCDLNDTLVQELYGQLSRNSVPHNLQELDLSCNNLGDGCSESLARLLSVLPSLTVLKLSYCSLTLKNKRLLSALREKPSLATVDVSANVIGSSGISELWSNLRFAAILDFSRTQWESGLGRVLAKFLPERGGTLQKLGLNGCFLTDDDLKTISESSSACQSLHELDVGGNPDVTVQGVTVLLSSMERNLVPLTRLKLEGTFLWRVDTASLLYDAFRKRTLRSLTLSSDADAREALSREWTNTWGDNSVIRKQFFNVIELSVVGK